MEAGQMQAEERVRIFGGLFLVSNRLETIGNEFLGELTTKQWFFLAVLFTFFTEPPTLSELSQFIGSSHQNLKQIALKLEKKGFIKLCRDEHDGRALRIAGTEKSARYGEEFGKKGEMFLSLLFRDFTGEELSEFTRLTDKLLVTLTEMQNTKNYMEE